MFFSVWGNNIKFECSCLGLTNIPNTIEYGRIRLLGTVEAHLLRLLTVWSPVDSENKEK